LKKWVECELEWAYYIDPFDIEMRKVRRKVPVGSVVLAKIRVKLSSGGSTVLTEYILAEEFGLRAITSKQEVGEFLSRQMVDYMRINQEVPSNIEITETYSNGDADLRYKPSDCDIFIVPIKQNAIGMNVKQFIHQLESNKIATSY